MILTKKNIMLVDYRNEKIHVQHKCRKKILATYSEPKKIPVADTSNVICFRLVKDFLIEKLAYI